MRRGRGRILGFCSCSAQQRLKLGTPATRELALEDRHLQPFTVAAHGPEDASSALRIPNVVSHDYEVVVAHRGTTERVVQIGRHLAEQEPGQHARLHRQQTAQADAIAEQRTRGLLRQPALERRDEVTPAGHGRRGAHRGDDEIGQPHFADVDDRESDRICGDGRNGSMMSSASAERP
jgi:hypothetical protein